MDRRILTSLLLAAALLFSARPASTQPLWIDIQDQSNISFEWLKANYESELDFSFFTSTVYLSGTFVVNPSFRIIADIPFSSYSASFDDPYGTSVESSGSVLGNPYIGVEFGNDERSFFAEGGIRLPAAEHNKRQERNAANYGRFADFMRLAAFTDDYIPICVMLNGQPMWQDGIMRLRLRLGSLILTPNKDRSGGDVFIVLGAYYIYDTKDFTLRIGYTGALGFEQDDTFSEAFYDEVGIGVQKQFGNWVPGIMLRLPLGEPLSETVNYTLGLNVAYRIE